MFLLLLACAPESLLDTPRGVVEREDTAPQGAPALVDAQLELSLQGGHPVEVLVRLDNSYAPLARVAVDADFPRAGQRHQFTHIPVMTLHLDSMEQLQRLRETPGVLRVEVDSFLRAHDTESGSLIGAPQTHSRGLDGSGTAVAILDTGLNYTHSDFGSCSAPGDSGCAVAWMEDFAADDGERDGASGHGTNVAGIVHQVAPGADLIGLDVFEGDGAWTSDILAALEWVVDKQEDYNIVAANMSLGGDRSEGTCGDSSFAAAITAARDAGVVVTVSSGNDGWDDATGYPACAPDATTVGAVYDSDVGSATWSMCQDSTTEADQVTCFSNDADHVDLLAPGSIITAAGISMSGTSQAAPHVAGAVAVLAAMAPGRSAQEREDRLIDTGAVLMDPRSARTHPRIDLSAATTTSEEDPDTGDSAAPDTGDSADPDTGDSAAPDTGDTGHAEHGFHDGRVSATVEYKRVKLRWADFEADADVDHYMVVSNRVGFTTEGCLDDTLIYEGTSTRHRDLTQASGKLYTYRVCAVDAEGKISNGTQAVAITIGDDPLSVPQGTIILNEGALESTVTELDVHLTYTPVVTEMCISEAPECNFWQPLRSDFVWRLPEGEGRRVVYAIFRDSAGQAGPPVRDTIYVNTTGTGPS